MNQLDGADERVNRSREHLEDLKRRIDIVRQAEIDNIVIERKPQRFLLPDGREDMRDLPSISPPVGPVPPRISVLVGEIIYNLRASLDYLVYELARYDAKQIIEKTQFPIEDCKKFFCTNRRNTYLKGVSDPHVAAIKKLQPFAGCNWTKVLRDLSNPDKHMHLTIIRSRTIVTYPPIITITPQQGDAEAILPEQPMDMKGNLSVYITFSDGTLVAEQLEQLLSHVAQTIDAFKPEFK